MWFRYSWAVEGHSLTRFFLNTLVYVCIYIHIYIFKTFFKVQLVCTLLPAHHKSSPHPHHPADPLHPFALPHLPFKRSSFLNLESLHLSYFSYIWKEGQEDFVSYVFPRSEVQCLWTKLPCERAFSSWTEEPEKLCYVQQDTCSSVHCCRQWKSRNTVLFQRAIDSISHWFY